LSEKVKTSIEKDPARYGYKLDIELCLDGLELAENPGRFAQMLNKEFKRIILEIQSVVADHDKFIEGKYYRLTLPTPDYYKCPRCGQWISENDRKEHEKRWFDYSVCPQPGGIIHIRKKHERS